MIVESPKLWRQLVVASGCVLHGYRCYHHQAHHILSQQNLRKHGKEAYLWDTRNGMCLCTDAHRKHDLAVARVPYRFLTAANKDFARDMGMEYLLDRYYPKEEEVPTYGKEDYEGITLEPVHVHTLDPSPVETVIDGPALAEKCPTCDRALPKPHKDEEEKVRKGWTIAVPVSELENGADVLDELLNECRHLFGHDESKKVKYYTIVQALALVVQNGHKMAAEA